MRSARAPILSIRSSTTAIAVASNAGATSIPGTRWRTAATSTACRARSRAREAKGVTLVASTSLYSVVCQVLKVSKCDLSRGLALFSTGTTRPDTPPRPTRLVAWMYSAIVFGWPLTSIRPSRGISTPTLSMLVARTTSSEPSVPAGVARRSSICLTSCWDLRDVSSSTAAGSRGTSPLARARRRRVSLTSSCISTSAPPSSRSELKYATNVQ